jgi:hypothetical protein
MNHTSKAPVGVDGRGGPLESHHYLIDRFPVSFQGGVSWHCQCREFAAANSCRHTREAAGMREAQETILARVTRGASSLGQISVRPKASAGPVYATVQKLDRASFMLRR